MHADLDLRFQGVKSAVRKALELEGLSDIPEHTPTEVFSPRTTGTWKGYTRNMSPSYAGLTDEEAYVDAWKGKKYVIAVSDMQGWRRREFIFRLCCLNGSSSRCQSPATNCHIARQSFEDQNRN